MKRLAVYVVFAVAVFLRIWQLGSVPPAPSLDEVSIGYNAYSILKTGRDEFGYAYPLLLRAYDDWRPALYVYLTVPAVALFGLTPVAVRVPSVLLSVTAVYLMYALGTLFAARFRLPRYTGLVSAFLLAVSPWHIYISRLGHESNAGFTILLASVFFLLRGVLSADRRALVAGGVLLGLSVHGYQSEKITAPILLAGIAVLFRKELIAMRRSVAAALLVCLAVAAPAVFVTMTPEGLSRVRGTSAVAPGAPEVEAARLRYAKASASGDAVGKVLNSRPVTYARIIGANFVAHLSPAWLFTGSDREAHKVPGLGLLYAWEILPLLLGIYGLARRRLPRRVSALLLLWAAGSVLPASVTTQAPHAMRAYTVLPVLLMTEAIGVAEGLRIASGNTRLAVIGITGIAVAAAFIGFWQGYFYRFPAEQSDSFQYALQSAVGYAAVKERSYEGIRFSHRGPLYQSYMFYLFYRAFDPTAYLSRGGTVSGGYDEAHRIGTYAFGYLPERASDMDPQFLYFYEYGTVPDGARTVRTFKDLSGTERISAAVKNP